MRQDHHRALSLTSLMLCATTLWGCPQEDNPVVSEQDMGASTMDMNTSEDQGDVTDDDQGGGEDTFSIERVEPSTGLTQGGLNVLIRGEGFEPGAKVFFGDIEATNVEVRSASQIATTTPAAAAPGAVSVSVELPGGDRVTSDGAFTYQEDVVVETPFFCQLQAQSPYTVEVNQPDASQLYAIVFADGRTQGAGAGSGVEAELGTGKGEDVESFTFTPMTYNIDKDGLTPGDLSNDEYGALPPVDVVGDFRYVARARLDGGEWIYCDLDGSENGVDPSQLGQLTVQEEQTSTPEVTYCQLLPSSDPITVETGQLSSPITVRVFSDGVTSLRGEGVELEGELGYGADLVDLDALTYVPLSYARDADGLNAGDLANDEYEAALLLDLAGTYRYIARFKVEGEPEETWFYCDLDGHSESSDFSVDQAGTIAASDPVEPSIGFCRTETERASIEPGETTPSITGAVYLQGVTEGAGEGDNIRGQLLWGDASADPTTWTNIIEASYIEDTDGLNPGDLANDRYSATIAAPVEGDFAFAYRFSIDDGGAWTWCDTDGSASDPATFEPAKVGALEVSSVNTPDFCRVQFPFIVQNAELNQPITIYGRLYELGVTDVGDDAASSALELWVGPASADAEMDAALFDSVPMTFFAAVGDDDEYSATWTPSAEGDYQFFVRASVDAGNTYTLCDSDGGSFEGDKVGIIKAFTSPPNLVDYCRVFQTSASWTVGDMALPIYTAEIFESGLTENNGGANSAQIEAEVGYGVVGANPAVMGAYTWMGAPFTQVNPGSTNNYEYQGSPVDTTTPLTAGDVYDVVVRARRVDQSSQGGWLYCDSLPSSSDFLLEEVSKLNVQ